MKEYLKLSWAVIGALYIMLGILLFREVYPKEDYPAYDPEGYESASYYEKVSLSISKRDVVAQWVMAVGTLLLLGATLATLIYSIRATSKSLALTKRSVEAYIGREIGYLTFEGCDRTPPMGVGMHEHVWIRMLNHGPSIVHLIGFDSGFQCVANEIEADASPLGADAINRIIQVGQRFGTEGWDQEADALGRPLAIPLEVMERFAKTGGMLIMTLDFTYDSPFGVFVKRISVLINDASQQHQLFYGDLRYNVPIAQVPRDKGAQKGNAQPGKRIAVLGRPWWRQQQGREG